jgi:hypothetical protein
MLMDPGGGPTGALYLRRIIASEELQTERKHTTLAVMGNLTELAAELVGEV